MREIKFRAWAKKDKIMVEDIELGKFDDGYVLDAVDCKNDTYIDDFEWMQYTGLKDKKGKEIYEGDICKFNCDWDGRDWKGVVGQVMFYESRFELTDKNGDSYVGLGRIYGPFNIEIIGNIYENPELVK